MPSSTNLNLAITLSFQDALLLKEALDDYSFDLKYRQAQDDRHDDNMKKHFIEKGRKMKELHNRLFNHP